nr:flagellar hook-length control protein FliK [uncultured Butyrivibrio sp.]
MSNITGISQSANKVILQGNDNTAKVSQSPVEIKNGSTLSGRVVSITDADGGKVANIDIGNATISAKLSDGMGLREGQVLSFAVRGSSSGQVSITPLLENTSIDQSTLRALQAAGLEVINDSVQMVKEMMQAGLPIDKASLYEMSKNVNTYSDTSISTLVEMKSLGIPINENNIEQYTNYKNYEHQVLSDMADIVDELPDAFKQLMESGNTSKALDFYGQMLSIFGNGDGAYSLQSKEISGNQNALVENSVQGQEGLINSEALELTQEPSEPGAKNLLSPEAGADAEKALEGAISKETADGKNQNLQDKGNFKFSSDFANSLSNVNISEKTIDQIKNGNSLDLNAQKQLFKELSDAFSNANLSDPVEAASWKKLFSSDDFGKLLKENIKSAWLLKPDEVENKENVDKLYQRLGTQAKALAEAVNNTFGAESKIAHSANNLSNNLDFMNQLNQMFQYIQLPLQMQGQNANGDLYVYRNKNKKLSEDGSVSAVLHLDMENLGPVDVFVKLLDTKVTTNFYVADDTVLDLINDNIHILDERLNKRGYSMQVNIKLLDDDSENAAVDEMLMVSKTPVISTASFDARA